MTIVLRLVAAVLAGSVSFADTGWAQDASRWADSSSAISKPAQEGRSRASPSVEAWARWAAEKASLQ